MTSPCGLLVCNDPDPARTLKLEASLLRMAVVTLVTSVDGRALGDLAPGAFDAVLADVPCSCEGNVRKDASALLRACGSSKEGPAEHKEELVFECFRGFNCFLWVFHIQKSVTRDDCCKEWSRGASGTAKQGILQSALEGPETRGPLGVPRLKHSVGCHGLPIGGPPFPRIHIKPKGLNIQDHQTSLNHTHPYCGWKKSIEILHHLGWWKPYK